MGPAEGMSPELARPERSVESACRSRAGEKVKIAYYPLRDGRNGGFFVRVTLPDFGTQLDQRLPCSPASLVPWKKPPAALFSGNGQLRSRRQKSGPFDLKRVSLPRRGYARRVFTNPRLSRGNPSRPTFEGRRLVSTG